jgi:hypothetical protein
VSPGGSSASGCWCRCRRDSSGLATTAPATAWPGPLGPSPAGGGRGPRRPAAGDGLTDRTVTVEIVSGEELTEEVFGEGRGLALAVALGLLQLAGQAFDLGFELCEAALEVGPVPGRPQPARFRPRPRQPTSTRPAPAEGCPGSPSAAGALPQLPQFPKPGQPFTETRESGTRSGTLKRRPRRHQFSASPENVSVCRTNGT